MADVFFIEPRHDKAVEYSISLMKKNYESVGFIPKSGIERLSSQNGLAVGVLNNEPCGYILYQPPKRGNDVKIIQVVVPTDVQRKSYGMLLVDHVEKHSLNTDSSGIYLKVAWDLEANSFWQDIGYYCTGNVMGGKVRSRILNVYRKDFYPTLLTVMRSPLTGSKNTKLYAEYRQNKTPVFDFAWKGQRYG